MTDLYATYNNSWQGAGGGPAAGSRQSASLLYAPNGAPSMTSQYKDFHSGASLGMPQNRPSDLGHPGQGLPGMSDGWQNTDQEFREGQFNHTMDHMRQFQDMEQSQRNLALQRQRHNAIEAQNNDVAKKTKAGWKPSAKTSNTLLLIAIGLIALLLVDAVLRMRNGGGNSTPPGSMA